MIWGTAGGGAAEGVLRHHRGRCGPEEGGRRVVASSIAPSPAASATAHHGRGRGAKRLHVLGQGTVLALHNCKRHLLPGSDRAGNDGFVPEQYVLAIELDDDIARHEPPTFSSVPRLDRAYELGGGRRGTSWSTSRVHLLLGHVASSHSGVAPSAARIGASSAAAAATAAATAYPADGGAAHVGPGAAREPHGGRLHAVVALDN
mmetsp:Transcript_4413/g.13391  ORF Transcript_4413/g.13391 Transcript_4413/m.13391 type:complete len:204 (-) Transcript_4413:254-865(-)